MALAVAVFASPFEDTPTPPEGRWNSERESIQEEEHMTALPVTRSAASSASARPILWRSRK